MGNHALIKCKMNTLYDDYPPLEDLQDLLLDYELLLPDIWEVELADNINLTKSLETEDE